jgi:transposase InsO family protein
MKIHIDKSRHVWLSCGYLEEYGISKKTIKNWSIRNVTTRKYIDKHAFINYDTIPEPTRKRLPSKAVLRHDERQACRESLQKYFFRELEKAYSGTPVVKWRNEIKRENPQISNEHINGFARRASVFEKILEIYHGRKGELDSLHGAYLQLYPDGYTAKNRFCMILKKAGQNGILSAVVDSRVTREQKPRYGDDIQYFATYILSHNKAYSIKMSHDIFRELCEKKGCRAPGITWFQNFYNANKNIIDRNRFGKAGFEKDSQNYAKIIPALYSGDQWQMDGWRIPVYCKKYRDGGKTEYFVTYCLFAVLDAHSRKIIGFHISSENTESILKGLEMAVKETLSLPYEIVADNHSFNRTKEAGSLRDEVERLGVTWTVDSNPRRKAILERTFKTLGERHFKQNYGYIGQGVKSKEKAGITQQELKDLYTKPENFLTFDRVVTLTCLIIDKYNNSVLSKLGDTPHNVYGKCEKPHLVPVDIFKRISLFVRKSEYRVRHGQITIQRGAYRYEYQLPAKYSLQYNNRDVCVRYSGFDEIYLYECDTDSPICRVPQKTAIHGALANQTEKDEEYLLKNRGRIRGIEVQARKKKERLFDAASIINPDAYDAVNRITTPKDVIEAARQNGAVREKLREFGINPENVNPFPGVDEMLDTSLKPRKKENRHPFGVEGNNMDDKLIIE